MKRKRSTTTVVDHNASFQESILASIHKTLNHLKVSGSQSSQMTMIRFLYPTNIITGKHYRGYNQHFLQSVCLEHQWELPLFATFKQYGEQSIRIKSGSKAAGYIKVINFKHDENGDPTTEHSHFGDISHISWSPLFHYSQTDQTTWPPSFIQKVDEYRQKQYERLAPVWLIKLIALYEQRFSSTREYDIMKLERSAVQPLVLLACKQLLYSRHVIPVSKINSILTDDLKSFLWPACGIPHWDSMLEECWKQGNKDKDAILPILERGFYTVPEIYYSHLLYKIMEKVLNTTNVDLLLMNTVLVAQQFGLQFCYYDSNTFGKQLDLLVATPSRLEKIWKQSDFFKLNV